MKSYEVEITETLRRTVTVEARDYDDAIDKVRNAWRRSEYVLDADDSSKRGLRSSALRTLSLPSDGLVFIERRILMNTINDAQRLRKTRLFLNLTQRELSSRLGVSVSSISRYENERTPVSPRVRKWVNRKYRQYHLNRKVIKSSKDHSVCVFQPTRCYSIADDDKILHRLSFPFNYVFQYLGTQGIHHCFREVHGGWSRTYTNSQLIDKRIMEVPYFAMAG